VENSPWVKYLLFRFLTRHGSEPVCTVNDIAIYGKSAAEDLEDRLRLDEAEDAEEADKAAQAAPQDGPLPQVEAVSPPTPSADGGSGAVGGQPETGGGAERDGEPGEPQAAREPPADAAAAVEGPAVAPGKGDGGSAAAHAGAASSASDVLATTQPTASEAAGEPGKPAVQPAAKGGQDQKPSSPIDAIPVPLAQDADAAGRAASQQAAAAAPGEPQTSAPDLAAAVPVPPADGSPQAAGDQRPADAGAAEAANASTAPAAGSGSTAVTPQASRGKQAAAGEAAGSQKKAQPAPPMTLPPPANGPASDELLQLQSSRLGKSVYDLLVQVGALAQRACLTHSPS